MIHTRLDRKTVARGLTFWGQWAVAMAFVSALLMSLVYTKFGSVDFHYRILAVLTLLVSVPAYSATHVYYKRHTAFNGCVRLFLGWTLTLACLSTIGFLTKSGELFSRETLLSWAALGFLVQVPPYLILHRLSRFYHQRNNHHYNSLIIGSDGVALKLADSFIQQNHFPLVGVVSASPFEDATNSPLIVGELAQLRSLITEHNIRRLYISLSLQEAQRIEALYIDLLDLNVDVVWVPDLDSMMLLKDGLK